MNELLRFLERLFTEGVVRLQARPRLVAEQRAPVEQLLRQVHAEHALSVAGPAPAFDAEVALRAAELLADACWFLVSRDDPHEEVTQRLTWRIPHPTAGALLSADVSLLYLPQIYRRARERDAADSLPVALAELLRHWPLAGVLAGLSQPPLGDLDFAGSPGLRLLYAERLTQNPDSAWIPKTGPTRDVIELVFGRRNLPLPTRSHREPAPA